MVALFARGLELALHFAILGGLADVALQLHQGNGAEAVIHAVVVAIAIIIFAWAGKVAKKLLGDKK